MGKTNTAFGTVPRMALLIRVNVVSDLGRALYRPFMPTRWDGDDRGRGIGDAEQLVTGANELIASFRQPGWVAEQPEAHLRPHVEQWCQRDERLALRGASIDDHHAYVLDLEWRGEPAGVGHARAAVFSLIGSFAESATYVRQRRVDSQGDLSAPSLRFEVGTGELAPDTTFHPHGHAVVINVAGVV